MKRLSVLLAVVAGLLSACVGYVEPNRYEQRGDRDARTERSDRDRDGVPNRQDRRPDDPRRY
jgi:hypothetical protein